MSNGLYVIVTLIIIALIMVALSTKYFLKAQGFKNISFGQSLQGVFYYNPNDKRGIVDRQIGIGSTINFASKEGRLVLWVILAIPVTMILLILIALRISGK